MLAVVVMIIITPTGAFSYFLYKVKKGAGQQVFLSRQAVARASALTAAAEEAKQVAQGTATEAMAQTRDAIEVAKGISTVDSKLDALTEYLVTSIEGGQPAARPQAGRHSRPFLPPAPPTPAIGSGAHPEYQPPGYPS